MLFPGGSAWARACAIGKALTSDAARVDRMRAPVMRTVLEDVTRRKIMNDHLHYYRALCACGAPLSQSGARRGILALG